MTNNITTLKDTECTGCGACLNICPVGAITMQENSEGFLYPQVDEDKCTNCGLCKKTCPVINPNYKNSKSPECYAYMAKDEERLKSSSGGAFPVLAHWFINNGGYVAGAVWTEDFQVKHIVSNNLEDIERMRNSKYLQSDTKCCYKDIKQLLEDDKKVLFTGTPCQVVGLKSFLGKDYRKLYCVDIICHGVPSPKVFRKYIDEQLKTEDEKWVNTNFRDKIQGWKQPALTTTTTTTTTTNAFDKDIFTLAFGYNLCLRKSCGVCKFSKIPRQGDITIGDFWGIWNYDKSLNDEKGTSVILVNNPKGEFLRNILKENTKIIKKLPLKYAIPRNPNICQPSKIHKNRTVFFKWVENNSLKDTVDYCLHDKCDCMITNYWSAKNYGAILTCYGLQSLLESMDKRTKVINFVPDKHKSENTKTFSQKFADKYLNLTNECENYNDLMNLNNYCNTFITGSDQVFNYEIMEAESNNLSPFIYLLDFVNSKNKKLSFAASTGNFYNKYNNEIKLYMEHFLKQFDDISVREFESQDILKNEFNLDSIQIIDPVFNIPKDKLYEMCSQYDDKYKDKYIGYYGLPYWNDNWELDLAKKIGARLNLPVKIMSFNPSTDVEEWVSFIKNSEFFISNSYHGIAFSIIFNKPFVQAINNSSQERFNSLFKLLDIKNNSVSKFDIINWDELLVQRDWKKINNKIKEETTRSSAWLKNALSKEHIQNNQDVVNYQIAKGFIEKHKLKLLLQSGKVYRKYTKYKILSKILFGKKRKYYKNKRIKYKKLVNEIREFYKK